MAGEKLTDIVKVVTDVKPHHKAYIVDTDDTTDDPAGSSAQIEVANLVGKVLLQRITLSTAGEFDFDNIPQDYQRLIIQGHARSNQALSITNAILLINDDTTNGNYFRQAIGASNGGILAAESGVPQAFIVTGSLSPANAYSHVELKLESYAVPNVKKAMIGHSLSEQTASSLYNVLEGTVSSVTAAITRLRVRELSHPTDGLTGTLSLYGER